MTTRPTGRHHQKEGNQNGETMSPPCDNSPTVSPPEQSTAVAGEAALSTTAVREEDAEATDNTTALSLSSDSSSDAPPAAARVPKSTPAPVWKKSAPKASTPMRNRTKKSVVIDVDEWQEQCERQRLSSSGVDSSSSAAATATATATSTTKEDVGFQDSKPPAQSVSSSSTSSSGETEKLNETIDSIAQFGENDASSSAVVSSNSDSNAKVTAAQHKIVTADEQSTQESSQHRSTTAAVGGSYAARLARKQREMAQNNDLGSEISSPNNITNNNSSDRGGNSRTVATAARSAEGAVPRNTEPRPGDTIANSRYTAGAMGKRAMMGNVQAEITEAQSRARQARENRKQAQSQAEAAASAAQTPLRPPSSCALSSKAAMVQSGATPAHNSNNSTSQTHHPSDTVRAATLDGDAVSITHSQAALSTSSATTGSGSQDQQAAASQASSMESSLQQQPGAYPTAGRAPFANPYMGGRYRLGGGDPALSGEAITTQNNQNQGGHPFNESVSTLAMTDMSYSQQTRMGTSSHHPPVAIGSTGVRRRLESSGDMEEEEDLSTSHNNTNSQDPHNYDLGESTDDAHNNPGEIVAVCVEEDDLENNIRDEIIRSAAQADVVQDNSQKDKLRRALYGIVVIVLILLIIGISVGFLVRKEEGGSDDGFVPDLDEIVDENVDGIADENVTMEAPSQSPTALFQHTLERVREAGVLRCGIYETSGFDEASGERFGVDADWCRAVAAAVMGKESYQVQLVNVTFADRFTLLANDTIDLLAAGSTYTMDRHVFETEVEAGLAFSTPFMYDGLRFAGVPGFVACADDDMKNFFECRDLMVCVVGGSSYHYVLSQRLPRRQIQVVDGWQTMYGGLRDGLCNLIAAEGVSLGVNNVRAFGYTGNYSVGSSLYSKIPLSMVTRSDSPEWTDFINTIINIVLAAEQAGITQNTSQLASDLLISGESLFGEQYANMLVDVVATIGNYAELFDRHAASTVPREGLTLMNNGSTGLLFSHPFGLINNEGPGPSRGGTLEAILERGKLRCAIRPSRPGFAQVLLKSNASEPLFTISNITTGLDADFCRALATSVFSGSVDAIDFFEASSEIDAFELLAGGHVDVAAGMQWTVQNDVNQPTTGQGFSFSQPYFYGSEFQADITDSTNLCLATRQDDFQWSAFVYWLVASTFFAEENDIDQRLSNSMPPVSIFGPDFRRMFQDPILEFGNYGELYKRNVEPFIPRGGRNTINGIRNPGPQMYPMPGFVR